MDGLPSFSASKTAPPGKTRPRPVLMIPLRRCGSHALRLRLNNNTEFYSPYPLHIVDFMPLVPRYGDLSEDAAYFRLIVDVVGLQTASMVKWRDLVFDPVEIFDAIKDEKRSVHRVVWEMLLQAGELHQASIVMDKSLDSVHYADELLTLFPDMLFLNVVRDPRAQISSMNRAIIHDYAAGLNALSWLDAYTAAKSLVDRHPGHVMTMRYEDFLTNQEGVLKRICEFFGMTFTTDMLDVEHSHEAQKISKMSALWESNCFPPVMANKDKFKQNLSMEDIEVIETICKDYMHIYGYELMTEVKADVSASAMAQAREKSEQVKRDAWKYLEKTNYKDFVLRRFRADYLSNLARNLPDRRAVG